MISPDDETFLRRAIRLAMNGRGRVEPNPMVGCVLVHNGHVIGEGFHGHFGGAHAEPTALADCVQSPRGATAYVTLEPCCHENKKTPPCAPLLIAAGIARVVIGCPDPNRDVDGKGIAMLRKAGIVVDLATGQIAKECRQLIAPFVQSLKSPLPYVTLKWAESSNKLVGSLGRGPVRITGPEATSAVHALRTRSHGIGVGVGTVISDNPSLTVRDVPIINAPPRYVFDRKLRMPIGAKMLHHHETPVYIICGREASAAHPERVATLQKLRAIIDPSNAPADDTRGAMLSPSFANLRGKHLLIEPGPTIAKSFLPWADRLWVFRSATDIADHSTAPRAADIPDHYIATGEVAIGSDVLTEYLNQEAESFQSAVPSADFVLTRDPRSL